MILILLLYYSIVFSHSQSTESSLDCDFLKDSFEYEDESGNVQNYTGECCTPQAIENLTPKNNWEKTNKGKVVIWCYAKGLCEISTTTVTTTISSCGYQCGKSNKTGVDSESGTANYDI
uniref:Uncharacterized protein n=1 Tax=Caenorhabditis tropicalis TaxID=1561998 RepID=A0A1I7T7T3_9PELO